MPKSGTAGTPGGLQKGLATSAKARDMVDCDVCALWGFGIVEPNGLSLAGELPSSLVQALSCQAGHLLPALLTCTPPAGFLLPKGPGTGRGFCSFLLL